MIRRLLPSEPWRRNQAVMVTTVFVVFTGFAFVIPFLPLYVRQLGVQNQQAVALWSGALIGVAPLLAGLLAPVWGRLADRHGQKPMAMRALGSYVVLLLLSALVTSVPQLLALRIGVGLFGGIGPLGLAMATSLAPRDQTGKAVGQVQAAQILSAAIGPLAGGVLADIVGIRWTFVATAGLCALALVLLLAYYQEAPRRPSADGDPPRPPFTATLRLTGVPLLLLVLFLVNFVGRSFTPILPLHVQALGVGESSLATRTGILISGYSMAAALSATLLGRASRSYSPRRLLILGLAAGTATVLPMALVPSYAALLALAIALGLASGGALTLCYTIGGLMVPALERTTAFGFFSAAALFGGSVSPLAAGALSPLGLRGIYYLDAALFLVAALLALLSRLGKPPAASQPAGT
ncbi:MAG TPA: MFS transporter [Vicinamibacteria bacterium]|nr:MFS transporter [Vicinamibacteria bacterium]